jgi:radical SAM superfamily enzyme YgiQ (UPF0313 family)
MRVLLVSCYTIESVTRIDRSPSLALLSLAAVLRQAGHEPALLDLDTLETDGMSPQNFYVQAVLDAIGELNPGMIGLNCLLSAHFPFVRSLADEIKNHFPHLPVATGGIHPTLFAEDILRHCPSIDAIALGEGERQVLALAEAYSSGKIDLRSVDALAFRDATGKIVVNQHRSYIQDLDSLPVPAWDMVRVEDYFSDHSTWYNPRGLDIKMSAPILTSRSCPYTCSFCSAHYVMGRGLRLRSAERVVDEMQMLYDLHGVNYFGFIDDNMTLNKKHVLAVFDEIVRRGLVIQFETICGYNISSLDEEIVQAMVRAGCAYVILPIEHGSDRIRNDIIGKRLPREKIYEVVELYKRHNLLTRGVFIMGFPEDTPETLMETYKMILDLRLDMSTVLNLVPFPGTRIFDQALRDNLFINGMDVNSLWQGKWDLNAMQDQFYLKPYAMRLDELNEFRAKFDSIRFLTDRVSRLQEVAV